MVVTRILAFLAVALLLLAACHETGTDGGTAPPSDDIPALTSLPGDADKPGRRGYTVAVQQVQQVQQRRATSGKANKNREFREFSCWRSRGPTVINGPDRRLAMVQVVPSAAYLLIIAP